MKIKNINVSDYIECVDGSVNVISLEKKLGMYRDLGEAGLYARNDGRKFVIINYGADDGSEYIFNVVS
jgi:hypothetical protein